VLTASIIIIIIQYLPDYMAQHPEDSHRHTIAMRT
jgi:hypothetical protein